MLTSHDDDDDDDDNCDDADRRINDDGSIYAYGMGCFFQERRMRLILRLVYDYTPDI